MKHDLSITWLIDGQSQLRSDVVTVAAETSLGRLPLLEVPDSVEGSLIDVPVEQIMVLKVNPGVFGIRCRTAVQVYAIGKRRQFRTSKGLVIAFHGVDNPAKATDTTHAF